VGCWGCGVWLLRGSVWVAVWVAEIGLVVVVCCNCGFWIAYLGFKISDFVYCVLGLGLLRVRFIGFSFFVFLVLLVAIFFCWVFGSP